MAIPKIININHCDVDSETPPQTLVLALRAQIRDVFSRRHETASAVLSDAGIDAMLNLWWKNHRNFIRAASIRPEWDWKTLSLNFDKNVSRPVDLFEACHDYLTLLARPYYGDTYSFAQWSFSMSRPLYDNPSDSLYLGDFHVILYQLFAEAFINVVCEDELPNENSVYTDADSKLSVLVASQIKSFIDEHTTNDRRGAFCTAGIASMLSDDGSFVPFNKLPKAIFDKLMSLMDSNLSVEPFLSNLKAYFIDHRDDFYCDLYKSIGAHQVADGVGPVKTTLTSKLVKSYYEWLTALSVGCPGNPCDLVSDRSFESYLNRMKNEYRFLCLHGFKRRTDGVEGYTVTNEGSFEQVFARLQENVKGSFTRESFIVSAHPCDMITCSLGHNWSSCQSFIDDFTDLPVSAGRGRSYSGAYNKGNFQFLCANCMIAYIPYERVPNIPQYLWEKLKRCLIWVGNNLDCMRQNFFYPNKQSGEHMDPETLALGKVIREYIQDVVAPFNFSNGTMDWKVVKCNGSSRYWSQIDDSDFDKFDERYDPSYGVRYDDPIMALSYLKTAKDKPVLYYALNFPRLDTGLVSSGRQTFFSNTRGTCPVCGKHTSHGGYCSKCLKELVDYKGQKVHPKDLITLKVNGKIERFGLDDLDKLADFVVTDEGTTVEFKSAYKVFMPSGIRYYTKLPDFVKKCRYCGEYFHPSMMVGDVCVQHFNSALSSGEVGDVASNIDDALKAFMSKTLSFDCRDSDCLSALLRLLGEKNVYWCSGKRADEFIPSSSSARLMYLSLGPNGLVLSANAKSTVVKLSNLFKKGGDDDAVLQ